MGMAADEEVRSLKSQLFLRVTIVPAGIAANVCHVHPNAFTLPSHVMRQPVSKLTVIDVPIHASSRFVGFEPVKNFGRAKIAGMPQLVTIGEMRQQVIVQKAMSVGKQADTHFLILRAHRTLVGRQARTGCERRYDGYSGTLLGFAG
jgi:hypothetical protein